MQNKTIRIGALYHILVAFNVYLSKIDSETAEISKCETLNFKRPHESTAVLTDVWVFLWKFEVNESIMKQSIKQFFIHFKLVCHSRVNQNMVAK